MTEEFEFYKNLGEAKTEEHSVEEKAETRSRLRRRKLRPEFVVFCLVGALVLTVIFLAAYRSGTGFDVLRRHIKTASLTENADGSRGSYRFRSDRSNRFAMLGDELLVASSKSLVILDGAGGEVYREQIDCDAPETASNGSLAAVYEVDGKKVYCYDGTGPLASIDCEGVLAVTVNADGYMAITDSCSGYKDQISVYNEYAELLFSFRSSEHFVTDAIVTADNKHLAVVTLTEENGVFRSNILFYRLNSTDLETSIPLDDAFVTHLGAVDGKLALVADTCFTAANNSGELLGQYDYSNFYLRGCDFGGDGYVTLLLGRYKAGSIGVVMTLNMSGELLSAYEVTEEVLDISASGHYVAVLFADRLAIFTGNLKPYAEHSVDHYRHVYLRRDGTAMVLTADSACIIVP